MAGGRFRPGGGQNQRRPFAHLTVALFGTRLQHRHPGESPTEFLGGAAHADGGAAQLGVATLATAPRLRERTTPRTGHRGIAGVGQRLATPRAARDLATARAHQHRAVPGARNLDQDWPVHQAAPDRGENVLR